MPFGNGLRALQAMTDSVVALARGLGASAPNSLGHYTNPGAHLAPIRRIRQGPSGMLIGHMPIRSPHSLKLDIGI
uniref:Uncharacterized protein n=1 Tax=Talaromyces marneffei PM1 TaxID=1077442 RepID=A0A093V4S0_TALMA